MDNGNTGKLLERLLEQAIKRNATGLRFASDTGPVFLIGDEAVSALGAPLSAATVLSLLRNCLDRADQGDIQPQSYFEFEAVFPNVGPVSCRFKQHRAAASLWLRLGAGEFVEPVAPTQQPNSGEAGAPNPTIQPTPIGAADFPRYASQDSPFAL